MKSLKWSLHVFAVVVVSATITGTAAQEAVPMLINYQGELRDPSTGETVPDGEYTMLFTIYDVEFGGTPLWEQIHSTVYDNAVEVRSGMFNVLLGSGTGGPLEASVFNGADRWLEVRVETQTLEPRQRITSAAYSIVSENSRLLDGKEASEFAQASHPHSGSDITSGSVAESRIDASIARDSEVDSRMTTHSGIADAHHPKTTSFSELTDTASDSQIPATIARGSEVSTEIATHAGTANAHHSRYTDSEAVAAMGTKTDTNPLHHDKTTSFSELSGAASDGQIPAGVARDTEVDSKITDHAAVTDAHHAKTTSFAELTDTATDAQIPNDIAINHAATAGDADTLDGLDSAAFLSSGDDFGRYGVAANLHEGTQTLTDKYVNTTGPDEISGSGDWTLRVRNMGEGYALLCSATSSYAIHALSGADDGYGVYGICNGEQGAGVVGSTAGTNGHGVSGSAGGRNGRGVVGTARNNDSEAMNYGGYFEARGGKGRGVTGLASNSGEVSNYGGFFRSDGVTGRGVYGIASGSNGVGASGTAYGNEGQGVRGVASYDGDGINYGGYFQAAGRSGRGVSGSATGKEGRGVLGVATSDDDFATNYGGYFVCHGGNGWGVYALATGHAGSGLCAEGAGTGMSGVLGKATGQGGTGVIGVATNVWGVGVHGLGKEAGVYSEGDLVVTGAYRGDIGPNNGAPFPRPAYDSGWRSIDEGKVLTLEHSLGGDPDNYVVDMQFKVAGGDPHQRYYGADSANVAGMWGHKGASWHGLTSETIDVSRGQEDKLVEQVRVRIWVYN